MTVITTTLRFIRTDMSETLIFERNVIISINHDESENPGTDGGDNCKQEFVQLLKNSIEISWMVFE